MSSWKTVNLGEICEIERGGSPRPISEFVTNDEDGVNWIKITDATASGKCIYATEEKIIPDGVKRSRMVYPGDFILSNSMSFGRPYIMQTSGCIHDGWLVLRKPNADTDFLYYILSSEVVSNQFESLAAGSTVRNLNVQIAKEVIIPLPPVAEQRKIAEILRTWDEAIETAEAELKAKQERKRWLMDKLLRLGAAGFSKLSASGWTVQKLGDILEIRHGKNQREVETPEGSYPILGTGGIIGRTNAYLYDKPSVLIGRKGTIDRPQYMDTPFWTIDTLFYTSISDCALPRFIFYVFCTINWQQYNAATGVPSLAASTIESIKIQLPPLAEQRKIADILQAVDADMEVINCRIETLRAQKRGLMQKLLTGEVLVTV